MTSAASLQPTNQQFTEMMRDKMACTVVSFVPFDINENKPGLSPANFHIPKAQNLDVPSVVHIHEAGYFVYISDGRSYHIKTGAHEVARSIVEDYVNSHLEVEFSAKPALAWFVGRLTWEDIQANPDMMRVLEIAKEQQFNWWRKLCRLADNDWAKYQRHNTITDVQRVAAQYLKLDPNQHPWLRITKEIAVSVKKCPSCATPKAEGAIMCAVCRAIFDKAAYDELNFAGQ